jgi:transmembrane sensor
MSKSLRKDTLRIAEEAAEWLHALEAGEAQTQQGFVEWLQASPRHLEEFMLVTASEKAYAGVRANRPADLDELIEQGAANAVPLDETPPSTVKPTARHYNRMQSSWRLAAGIVALAFSLGALYWYASGRPISGRIYATEFGEQRSIELEDGSLVHLNARTRLGVHFSEKGREIQLLEGEALFKVAHDALRPFRVDAGSMVIRALGTEFNVNRTATGIKVAVIEGLVEITRSESKRPAASQLKAGDGAKIRSNGEIQRVPVDATEATAWRQRRLVFRNSTLEEIATEFNRYNRSPQLIISDDALRSLRYGGTFDADQPQALFHFLSRDNQLVLESSGKNIVIRLRQ